MSATSKNLLSSSARDTIADSEVDTSSVLHDSSTTASIQPTGLSPTLIQEFQCEAETSTNLYSSVETPTSTCQSSSSPATCEKHRGKSQDNNTVNCSNLLSSNPTLCGNCSKSMLSYISIMQNFLTGLAQDVSRQVDPTAGCVECVSDSLVLPSQPGIIVSSNSDGSYNNSTGTSRDKPPEDSATKTPLFVTPPSPHEKQRNLVQDKETITNVSQYQLCVETTQMDYSSAGNKTSSSSQVETVDTEQYTQRLRGDQRQSTERKEGSNYLQSENLIGQQIHSFPANSNKNKHHYEAQSNDKSSDMPQQNKDNNIPSSLNQQNNRDNDISSDPIQLNKDNNTPSNYNYVSQPDTGSNWQETSHCSHPIDENVDGIISVLYRLENAISTSANGETLWAKFDEMEQKGKTSVDRIETEAYVTIARNNVEVLGCLVLGSSLLACGTSRTVCVLVYEGVNEALMEPLSSVFHVVLHVRSLDSVGTTKLSLLDQPELGIYLGKLNIWRLQQFTKCVYLNPDTVVVQNCDELFEYEELSAVPDVGWPDCFNSAMFVFSPSFGTFCSLLKHAEIRGSYDGGDQGLLNTFFHSWSQDINKKLSFIYNLMANVSYTYTPAFRQFGRNVKIVQFMGPFKPWHVKFYVGTGQIAPSSTVHPTFVQFVNVWLSIFRICVLKLLSQEIRGFAFSQNIISGYDLLKFFPTGLEFEVDFLSPLSIRRRPSRSSITNRAALNLPQRVQDKSKADDFEIEKLQVTSPDDNFNDPLSYPLEEVVLPEKREKVGDFRLLPSDTELDQRLDGDSEVFIGPSAVNLLIPGSEVGDYQGMSAWEQGRMDYEGGARSDVIISRLRYLIGNSDNFL